MVSVSLLELAIVILLPAIAGALLGRRDRKSGVRRRFGGLKAALATACASTTLLALLAITRTPSEQLELRMFLMLVLAVFLPTIVLGCLPAHLTYRYCLGRLAHDSASATPMMDPHDTNPYSVAEAGPRQE